jgi:hypothetical protein
VSTAISGLPFATPYHPRRVRPTLRCYCEDFGLPLPPASVDLCSYTTRTLTHLRSICVELETYKRLLSAEDRIVRTVRVGSRRVAAWQEGGAEPAFCEPFLTWACAEGNRRDCYVKFKTLAAKGNLLPCRDDVLRHRIELDARIIQQAKRDVPDVLAAARAQPGTELEAQLGGIDTRLLVMQDATGVAELYVVLNRFVLRRLGNKQAQDLILMGVFRRFEKYCAAWEIISPTDYPGSALGPFEESVKYGLLL